VLGAIGALPGGEKYALVFGAWVAITELIPYLGPWLGAIPPFIYALRRASHCRSLGRVAVPRDPSDRGARRRPET
jgi:predicted PurR-regulated permease PerM